MRKQIVIGALMALGASAASAQSNVSLYGMVDAYVGVSSTQPAGGSSVSNTVVNSGGMSTSHFGMRGSEDLGGGLKAVFNIAGFLRPDTGAGGRFGADTLFSREAIVGLQGNFGTVQIGRNTAPYFLSAIIFNPFGDSFTFSPMVAHSYLNGYIANDSGWSNSVRWISPNMSGLTVNVTASPSSGLTSNEGMTSGTKKVGRSFGLQALYFSGPLAATIAYQDVNVAPDTTGRKQTALMVGGSYDLKVAKLFAQYQRIEDKFTASASNDKDTTIQLGASVPMGKGSLLVSGAQTKTDVSAGTDPKRTSYAIGYNYGLSKRTDLYAAAFQDKYVTGAGTAKNGTYGVGIRHRF